MRIIVLPLPRRATATAGRWTTNGLAIGPADGAEKRESAWRRVLAWGASPRPAQPLFFFFQLDHGGLLRARAELEASSRVRRWSRWATRTWDAWGAAAAGTWRHRAWKTGMGALNQIAAEEWFLKSLPTDVLRPGAAAPPAATDRITLEIELPPSATRESATVALAELVRLRQPFHRRRLWVCAGLLPLTTIVAIVGPNLPLFVNIYRTWSHYRALQGARWLTECVLAKGNESPVDVRWVYPPSLGDAERALAAAAPNAHDDRESAHAVRDTVALLANDKRIEAHDLSEQYMRAWLQNRARVRGLSSG